MNGPAHPAASRSLPGSFVGGAVIGALGGLVGLGGAEFRLAAVGGDGARLLDGCGGFNPA
jgi:hypothetical protein